MNNTNDDIFLEFWQTYVWPEAPPLFFRLYHDVKGRALKYSRLAEPGLYIDISPEDFAIGDLSVTVKNGRLVRPARSALPRLVPSDKGTRCHAWDVTIIVPDHFDNHRYWEMQTHEQD